MRFPKKGQSGVCNSNRIIGMKKCVIVTDRTSRRMLVTMVVPQEKISILNYCTFLLYQWETTKAENKIY